MLSLLISTVDKIFERVWLAMSKPDASALTNLIVALIAYAVYRQTRKNQISDAAALVELDIRLMSDQIDLLRRELARVNPSFLPIHFPFISLSARVSNSWSVNKTLLASSLTVDDISNLNKFINDYCQLRDAYEGAVLVYESNLKSKASTLQQMAANEITGQVITSSTSPWPSQTFLAYENLGYTFAPDYYLDNAKAILQQNKQILNTSSFNKLLEISKRNRSWISFR